MVAPPPAAADVPLHRALGLTDDEADVIATILGRAPNHLELYTLVPTRIYFRDGRAKAEIALARGKDVGDKRQSIKEREMKREMDRAVRR